MKGYQLPTRPLVTQSDSATIESARVPRSKYINKWTRKTALRADYLTPILVEEILPGDHMKYDVTAFVRMATPLFPQFDSLQVSTFFFFVPNRLVWEQWQYMMGEQRNYNSPIDYTVPQVTGTVGNEFFAGSIYDHMGIPTDEQIGGDGTQTFSINALPFRAYDMIFNEWFRDENLQLRAAFPTDNGPDTAATYFLQWRNKAHDYFTSALPWTQKFPGTTVPIGEGAPIRGIGVIGAQPQHGGTLANVLETEPPLTTHTYDAWSLGTDAAPNNLVARLDPNTGFPLIYADLSQSTGVAINTLRQAFLIQQLLERDARGGTRYVELIRSHFGVINPDFRLQRPEYIGGGVSPLNITPIAQTAPTTGVPLGALGGAGTAAGTHTASYAATEHGHIIGVINIRADISYQQGLHRLWTRRTRYDFYWPALAGLGEQAILQKEITYTGVPTADERAWGYQERWQEYRTKYSEVTGFMRSGITGSLDAWHLAEYFDVATDGLPSLNEFFLRSKTPLDRVLAAGELAAETQFLADIMYQRVAVRPLPMYGTPVMLGRF